MAVWDWICGRKEVNTFDAEGLDAVAQSIRQFEARTFFVKDGGFKSTAYNDSEIQSFFGSIPQEFTFRSQIKTYTDRSGCVNLRILLKCNLGLCSQFNRYNPLNRTYLIQARYCKTRAIITSEAQSA